MSHFHFGDQERGQNDSGLRFELSCHTCDDTVTWCHTKWLPIFHTITHIGLAIAMAPNDIHIDPLLTQLTAPNTSINNLSSLLKNGIPRETRETVLSSFLSNGQDPLMLLDVRSNTLAVLYILWVAIHLYPSSLSDLLLLLVVDLPGLAEVFLILNLLLGLLFKSFVGGLTLNMPVMHLIVVCGLCSLMSIVWFIGRLGSHQIGKRDSPSGFALW